MYFDGSGRARSKALYKRNQLGSCSCGAFIASGQDVPAFKTGLRDLAFFPGDQIYTSISDCFRILPPLLGGGRGVIESGCH